MYVVTVVAFMLVLPAASIATEVLNHGLLSVAVVKWYVFWAVGARLLLAGVRQIVQPQYTAQTILGIKGEDALLLVRELGFANCALGGTATASLWIPQWTIPAGVAGAVFYGLAGVNHLTHPQRTRNQQLAMGSDLFAALVLAVSMIHG
jgi:hypothetical protein